MFVVGHERRVFGYLLVLGLADGSLPFDRPADAKLPFVLQVAAPSMVTVNGNWRLIFRFDGTDVELVDYLD
jgi:toxin HigB-1